MRPSITGRTLAAVLAIGSVVMVGGGVFAAAVGERHIEVHSEEHAGDAGLVQLGAKDVAFEHDTITLKADAEVEIQFDNNDRDIQHNISIIGQDPTKPIFRGQLVTGRGHGHLQVPRPARRRVQVPVRRPPRPDEGHGQGRLDRVANRRLLGEAVALGRPAEPARPRRSSLAASRWGRLGGACGRRRP